MKLFYSITFKIITFLLLLICITGTIALGMNTNPKNRLDFNMLSQPDFKKTSEYKLQVRVLYSQLCVLSVYFENLNDGSIMDPSPELIWTFQNIDIFDHNNEIKNLSDNFVYSLSIGKNYLLSNSSQVITKEYLEDNFDTFYFRTENQLYSSEGYQTGLLSNMYETITDSDDFFLGESKNKNSAVTIYLAPKNEYINHNQKQLIAEVAQAKRNIVIIIPLLFFAFLLIIIQVVITGKTYSINAPGETSINIPKNGRFHTEIIVAEMLACILVFFLLLNQYENFKQFSELLYGRFLLFEVIFSSVIALIAGLFFLGFLYIIRRLKQHNLIRSSYLYVIFKIIWSLVNKFWKNYILMDFYKNHTISKRLFLRQIIFFSLISSILLITIFFFSVGIIFLGLVNLLIAFSLVPLYIYQCNKDFKEVSVLCEHISQLHNGNNEFHSVVSTGSPVAVPAMQLNNISEGFQRSVIQQVKAERIKIDLVTNVSHDLKTPLTSIIGYIDLLSKQELNPEASDYVKILQMKADRLKQIVSDLFELAKITSGNEELDLEELDCVVLVNQVVADMEDAILASGRSIRVSIEQENAPVFADGKKLYRIFQNLLDNALKYSMHNTRIFIDLKVSGDKVVTTIKNTASYEIHFNVQEILERFTRGDKSRTGEGNGLGLSIAKGLANACGGDLIVDIDGDLFKVIISFPMIKK